MSNNDSYEVNMAENFQPENSTLKIEIRYYAKLKQEARLSHETLELPAQASLSLAQVYDQLQEKYQFTIRRDNLRVACNHKFGEWDQEVQPGDYIAFIPPISGG